jgi:hypothetical protein
MLTGYPMVVLAPVAGLAADCASQVLWARAARRGNPYTSLAVGIVMGFAVAAAVTAIGLRAAGCSAADAAAFSALNLAAYLALAFGYFNFVNLAIASLRIRLLCEILDAGGSLPRATLLAGYNTAQVIDLRLRRLVGGGHLVDRNGRLVVGKRRFLGIAIVYNILRRIVIGPWPPYDAGATTPETADA